MASLHVLNLYETIVGRLKRRAARHGNSAESEVRAFLQTALASETEPGFEALAAELRALTGGRTHTPAEELVREAQAEHM